MTARGDEPAYPVDDWSEQTINATGLTIREWFAGMAMQGMVANQTQADAAIMKAETIANMTGDDVLAVRAYGVADAMIAQAMYAAAHPEDQDDE